MWDVGWQRADYWFSFVKSVACKAVSGQEAGGKAAASVPSLPLSLRGSAPPPFLAPSKFGHFSQKLYRRKGDKTVLDQKERGDHVRGKATSLFLSLHLAAWF